MPKSDAFDRLTELAAALFEAPIALITALEADRQWFRSKRGYDADQTTWDEAFCRHMVGSMPGSVMVVEDARADARFSENRLVIEDGVRFYAGAIITTADGAQDGAVCVLDTQARGAPTAAQIESLRLLAQLAGRELDHQRLHRREAEHTGMLEMSEAMAGVGHWRYDVAKGRISWSDEVFRIHGLEPGSIDPTLEGMGPRYHAEDRDRVQRLIDHALATGEGYDTRLRLYRDGEERVTRVRARVERDEHGQPCALFGVFQDITDMVRAQERIERSEALFRLMGETSQDVVARFDDRGRFLYVSPSAMKVLGRDPETMLGKDCAGIILEEDLATIRTILTDYVRAGPDAPSPRYEYRARKADGSLIWLEATPRVIRDEAGRVVEFHDCVRDITARKAAEREQAELVETLKLAEDLAGVGCWKLDVGTGRVRWSDHVYRIHGVTPQTFDPSLDDAVGFYHPDDQQGVRDWCASAIQTGVAEGFRFRLIRSDGEERIVESQCRPERGEDGTTKALFGVFQDVTDRVRGRQRLEASEARYRLLADNSTDVIATYGMDGRFRYLSPSIKGAMGYSAEELINRPFSDFMHPEDIRRVQKAFADYAKAGPDAAPPRVPYRGLRKDGSVVWLEAHPKVIRDADGRPVEFQDVVRDISINKALEEQLIEARDVAEAAARAKSEFLANMSHELRTPLTAVVGFSGLLKSSEALPEAERLYADRIGTASDALLSVINDILDYSKLEADAVGLDPVAFDPGAMARGTAAMLEAQCEAKGLTLKVEIASDLPTSIMADEGRLRQVMLNFLSNAVKFTASGEIGLKVSKSGKRVRVEVSDSGIGIAPDKIDALFERFTQADASTTRVYGGTGLGLAISRRLIELMGGDIGADSRAGEGSTFWFEVPLVKAAAGRASASRTLSALPPSLKVLMADDAPANRELVRIMLEAWDVKLDTVVDGAQAVQAVATNAYDIVLMDVHMPVMDGMDASRAIRSLGGPAAATPILALTANIQPEQVEACRRAGMDGHVGKPIQVATLIAEIARALAERGPADMEAVA